MIKHGNLKDDLMSALNLIDELKGVSIQARFLASKILRCHPDWKISWTYFAKICGVNLSTICRWKDELEKAKIWHCEDIIKDGKKEILITFLIKNKSLAKMQTLANLQLAKMQTLANLQTIKERKICNFSQKRDEFFSNEKNYFKKTSKKNFCENENFAEKSENLCENTKQILAENEARDMLLRTKFRQERS